MICYYHSKDLDGYASGAVVKRKYPTCKLIGWDYKDPIPDLSFVKTHESVILIDITFPIQVLVEFGRINKNLTVIDHHISFKKEYDALPESDRTFTYVYENGIAACEIGWNYFFPDELIPTAIKLLGRYDTWRQSEGYWESETLPFQYFMRTECTSAETFDPVWFSPLLKQSIRTGIDKGLSVLKYQEQQDQLACERSAFERDFQGFRAICLNARAFSSNTMKSVYDPSKHDLMMGIEYTGKEWTVSLRADKPEVNVSLFAKQRGGGGHAQAAGFQASSLEEIFTIL